MQFFLDENRIRFNALLSPNSPISIPFNAGRRTGFKSLAGTTFKPAPPAQAINLSDWASSKISKGDIQINTLDIQREGVETLLGYSTGVNMNVTTDQAIPLYRIGDKKFLITRIVVGNASVSLTTAQGGVYTATSKGGTAIVAASQAYTALSAPAVALNLTIAANRILDINQVFLSLTTAQGAAATADIYVFGIVLP